MNNSPIAKACVSAIWLLWLCKCPIMVCAGSVYSISSLAEFKDAIAVSQPGDTIRIMNGEYTDWHVDVSAVGSVNDPIRIEPETMGGVEFTATGTIEESMFRFTGKYLVFSGFTFRNISFRDTLIRIWAADGIRITNCLFEKIKGYERHWRLLAVEREGKSNRIDHCVFRNNDEVQTITVRVSEEGSPRGTQIDHNRFENLNLNKGGEGTEVIQIAQSGRDYTYEQLEFRALVEHNSFENIRGDAETISNKSNRNIYRYNSFYNCREFVIRGGHHCIVEYNTFENSNGSGIRMYGSGHIIQHNTIKNPSLNGITLNYGLGSGIEAKTNRITTTDCVIYGNTVLKPGKHGVFLGNGKGTDYSDHKNRLKWNTGHIQDDPPRGNFIAHNQIHYAMEEAIKLSGAIENIIDHNKIKISRK